MRSIFYFIMSQISKLKNRVTSVTSEVSTLTTQVGTNTGNITSLQTAVGTNTTDITNLKNSVKDYFITAGLSSNYIMTNNSEFLTLTEKSKNGTKFSIDNGNIVVGDGELSDPKMIDENSDSIWMGYSEMELGFLTPEEMPNCYNSGEDVGLYSPAVQYNGEYYLYVNDFLKIFSKNARTPEELEKLEKLQQYADVWCTYPNSEGELKVLGGLEEYGRYRAQQGGNVE